MKRCACCGETKSLDQFYVSRTLKSGHGPYCKSCSKSKAKAYTDNSAEARDRRNRRTKAYRDANPELVATQIRNATYKKSYGITYDEFITWAANKGNRCEICGVSLVTEISRYSQKNKAVVDHCHLSGKIRGVLCHQCNSGIGMFKENKEIIMKAVEYLEGTS